MNFLLFIILSLFFIQDSGLKYEQYLPDAIPWRVKQEFSQGSGSADILPSYFEQTLSDEALKTAQADYPMIRSKETLYYF